MSENEADMMPEPWGVEWGQRLKQARIQAGLTQENLAGKLGVNQPTISNWERGSSNPSGSQIKKIEEVFGRSLSENAVSTEAEPETDLGLWLKTAINNKGIPIGTIAAESGVSVPTLYNILNAKVAAPQARTLKKLQDYFGQAPAEVAAEMDAARDVGQLGQFSQFDPHDESQWPSEPGVYILYDISDRPVYVGKSKRSIAGRLRDHKTRFWYKRPLVTHAAYVAVNDKDLVLALETLLIKFLRSLAVVNEKGVVRDSPQEDEV